MKRHKRFMRIQRVSDGFWAAYITGNDTPQLPLEKDGIVWTPDKGEACELGVPGLAHSLNMFFAHWKGKASDDLRFRWFRRGKARGTKDILRAIETLGAANKRVELQLEHEVATSQRLANRNADLMTKGRKLWEALNARMTEEDKAEQQRTGKLPWGDLVP